MSIPEPIITSGDRYVMRLYAQDGSLIGRTRELDSPEAVDGLLAAIRDDRWISLGPHTFVIGNDMAFEPLRGGRVTQVEIRAAA